MSVRLQGIGVSPGFATGPAYHYRPDPVDAPRNDGTTDPAAEWNRLEAVLTQANDQLAALAHETAQRAGGDSAAIFDAQRAFLHDPELLDSIRGAIFDSGLSVEAALTRATEMFEAMLEATGNPYLQERAVDLRDVRLRLLRLLQPQSVTERLIDRAVILIANDLTPSDTVQLDPKVILGIAIVRGGPTSHTAILARSLGIPAVVGVGTLLWTVPDGENILLDGASGALITAPGDELIAFVQHEQSTAQAHLESALREATTEARTKDGKLIEIAANVGRADEVHEALSHGADGIGLLRTEFVYMEQDAIPDEAQQTFIYRDIAAQMSPCSVIVRALDIGGDKPLPYLPLPAEDNPFLGQRGIRLLLAQPELFEAQLRAVLRANRDHSNLRLMLPMIADVREVLQTRAMIDSICYRLGWDSMGLSLGMMVETPAAAMTIDQYTPWLDFFSIGSNDLTQYTLAVDRGNASVGHLYDALHPAVLRLMKLVVDSAHAAGKWAGLCGELAGEPRVTPLLIGLGLDELSMSPRRIPAVKAAVRATTLTEAQALAATALAQPDADHVTHILMPPW